MERQPLESSQAPEAKPDGTALPQAIAEHQLPVAGVPAQQAAAPARPGRARRFVEWFWRGRALETARADVVHAPQRLREFHQRARTCFSAADGALNPRGSGPWTYAPYLACDLFRQSCHWALAAITLSIDDITPEAVWSRAERDLLIKAAGDADNADQLRRHIVQQPFATFAELPADEQKRLASALREFALRLLSVLEEPQRHIDRFWRQRVTRIGMTLAFFSALFVASMWYSQYKREQTDIVRGKPWRASSTWAKCEPARRRCGSIAGTDIFFHTENDVSPWLEIDLGTPQRFSSVLIENRKDCCVDRAIPLILEISNDGQNYREIVRRSEPFRSWEVDFSPKTARYVRVRVPRQTYLHLEKVALFPE